MANTGGMQFKGGTYKGQVVIDANQALTAMHNLDAALAKVGTTLANMARGRDVSALWNEEAASIENVTRALNEFNRSQNSIGSAEGLMKALNAFSAWHPDMSMTDIFSKLGDGADALISKAKTMASSLDSAFSVPSLRDAFEAFNALKAAGVDMEDVFSKLRQGDLSGLSGQVETLERALSRANIEIRDLESQLDSVKSGEAFAEMQQRISELENAIEMAKDEFKSFLQMNGFTGWDLTEDGRFHDYFQQIADGTMTATQAITEFKQQYSYMFSEMSGNELTAVLSELERITAAIEGMRNEITQMGASGSMAEMRVSLQEGAEAAKEQSAQLQQMTANASALDALITALTRLADASIESGEGAKTASTAVSELIGAVTGLGQTNIDSLTQLAEILKSLARMENVSVGKASMQNLVSALEALSKIPNMQSLTGLSTVDLRNFNDLHISKAALNNLATFLPTIATVDVASLQKLAAINWGNLSNLSINKSAVSNLKELATVMSGKPMSIEGMKVSIDESSLSSLSKAIEDSIQRASQNIKLTINNVELSAAAKAVIADEVAKAASSGGSGSGSGGSRGTGSVDQEKQALKELITLWKEYYNLAAQQAKYATSGQTDNANLYRDLAAAKREEIEVLAAAYPELSKQAQAYDEVQAALVRYNVAMNNMQSKMDSNIVQQTKAQTNALKEYQKQLDSLGIDKSGIKFGGDVTAVERYSAELNNLKAKFDAIGAASDANRGTAVAAFEAQKQKVIELRNELNSAAEAARNQAQAAKLADKIDLWAQKNPNAYKDAKDQVDQWLTTLRSQAPLAAAQIAEISNEFSRVSTQEKLAGNNGQSFFQTLKAGWAKFGGWSIVSRSFMSVIRIFKQAVTAVKEVDAAMTELRKVTDLTAEGYSRFYEQATKMAGEVGAKLSDVINSTAD